MAITERHHAEPSTDFPAFDDTSPCPELRVSRLTVGLVLGSALIGGAIGFLLGRLV